MQLNQMIDQLNTENEQLRAKLAAAQAKIANLEESLAFKNDQIEEVVCILNNARWRPEKVTP